MQQGYASYVRTTISLPDRLAIQVRRAARSHGLSVSGFIAKTLDDAIKRTVPQKGKPFRLVTVGDGSPLPEIDLDRPRALDVAEDEARFKLSGC